MMKFKTEEEYDSYQEYMSDLCSECAKTKNHCCLMDIPLDLPTALHLIYQGDKVGVTDTIIRNHPKFSDKVFICNEDTKGDISTKECVFFKDGKCAIYKDRPDICRYYGTKFMKCRSAVIGNVSNNKMDIDTMNKFDDIALNDSNMNKYLERIIV